ncbi:MAG: prepilin-type N-terminal cleavage/methylation domain-containing protein [Sulfuritalea sp.]|nr:prepilin-type N-terminal cleavage/methylation domain-containing protein [Sulfuritalea sp.]
MLQKGMTLMELIAALAIIATVIVGAVALYGNASSSSNAVGMTKDLMAVRSATQQLFQGQGGYGTASLNSTLITARKIPGDLSVSGSTISTPIGGTLTVTGNTSKFTLTVTNVPADVCTQMLTGLSTGWTSVKVGASAALTTFPVTPAIATAAAQCGGTAPFSIVWTTLN